MEFQKTLTEVLRDLARRKRRRIGIGVLSPNDAMLEGFRQAQTFCTPVLYGINHGEFSSVPSSSPEELLVSDLGDGHIDAAIRGQIEAFPFRTQLGRLYGHSFKPSEQLITVMEFPGGRPMIMTPASNVIAGDRVERADMIDASVLFCERMALPIKIGLLALCRPDDIPDESSFPSPSGKEHYKQIIANHHETQILVEQYQGRLAIRNYGIDFEKAYQDGVTILVEPTGPIANQVIRTLHFLNAVKFYGAPLMNAGHVVLESFKNSRELADIMLLAAAMANVEAEPREMSSL
jgi:predicted methyltransferase MtxX (methanogen marker protein 4)